MIRISLTIQLFGAFREYGEGELVIEAEPGSTALEVRGRIRAGFEAAGFGKFAALVGISALGNETEILGDSDRVMGDARLALLPPVCGGSHDGISVGVTEDLIDPLCYRDFLSNPAHGAQALFYGVIRNENSGRRALAVSYDVFEPLAVTTFKKIAAEAREKWGGTLGIFIRHRRGKCAVGDIAVLIAVGSAHRDEAYQASRFLIEAVKHQAPIWKKEHFEDGDSEWVEGHALCRH